MEALNIREYSLPSRYTYPSVCENHFALVRSEISRMEVELSGDKRAEEVALELSGNIHALQTYRYSQWKSNAPKIRGGTDLNGLMRTESALRENAQREDKTKILLREEPRNQALEQEISKLAKEYWILEREWWKIRASYREGPLTRAIDLWRSNPKWFMHSTLCEDCAGRGGCCGRECGCCLNRLNKAQRKRAVGHCTVECPCCEASRGFELSPGEKAQIREDFSFELSSPRRWYYQRIMRVSLMGLTTGDSDNPFDLIEDEPPPYVS